MNLILLSFYFWERVDTFRHEETKGNYLDKGIKVGNISADSFQLPPLNRKYSFAKTPCRDDVDQVRLLQSTLTQKKPIEYMNFGKRNATP